MFVVPTPNNYGLIPYGQASYAVYLLSQVPSVPTTPTIPVVEILGNLILPAAVKSYWLFPN